MKLYRYRPLSEFLFKELFYQELYFASYTELNDPSDLTARIEFSVKREDQIEFLIWLLFSSTLKMGPPELNPSEIENNANLIDFAHNEEGKRLLMKKIYDKLIYRKENFSNVWLENLEEILESAFQESKLNFKVDMLSFKNELQRLAKKFLENSYTTCFSTVNNDFLMWSHYASKHSGICLEFALEHDGLFPFKRSSKRNLNHENYLQRLSKWDIVEHIYWDSVRQVFYQTEQPCINFFDFSPVFDNEGDADLIGLSKGWTHEYAYELTRIFSIKNESWSYEKEWRSIEINFGEPKEPEERIRHYPIEALESIYFGIRTPENTKKRIYEIFKKQDKKINFFNCVLTNDRKLNFKSWEYDED